MADLRALYEKENFSELRNLDILRAMESKSTELFTKDSSLASYRAVLGSEKESLVVNAITTGNWEGIPEFTPEFYKVLDASILRQELIRSFIRFRLEEPDHGFEPFDAALISHSTIIANLYDKYYISWCKAVQGNKVAETLIELQKEGKVKAEFNNHYTVIQIDDKGELYHVPYATFFKDDFAPLLKAFDDLVAALKKVENVSEEQQRYIEFFEQYRKCLAETDIEKLEEMWKDLDMVWTDIKYWIQVVHDIEYGYGDPLRTKVIPDYSLRFVDVQFKEQNAVIQNVKKHMVDYFGQRTGDLAKKGLFALENSFAAIVYIPFQSGMSHHFRFSGQSIPNRSEVKNEKGVKVYFDPVSTAKRMVQTNELVNKTFGDDTLTSRLDAFDTIMYHVSSHEFGHAIYGLDHILDCISVSTKSVLEEPRAELTAMHFMKVLYDKGAITLEKLQSTLSSFAMQDLRRFAMFDSSALRPYTISAINCYKTYKKAGYIVEKDDKLVLDDSKAVDVLTIQSALFESILDAEDAKDGKKLETILKEISKEDESTAWLKKKLFVKKQ